MTDVKFFDAHTHVNLAAFKDDYRETINRALEIGIGMINAGADAGSSVRAVEIAREFQDEPIFATVGLHPDDASSGFNYDFYKKLALDSKVVGIGECGLDYFQMEAGEADAKEKQKDVFIRQIKLAHEVGKPLIIHCRGSTGSPQGDAFSDLIEILGENKKLLNNNPGVIHFMSGTKGEAEKLLDMGFYFTFGGVITFVRNYDELIKSTPIEKILSETDAPFVTPIPYRGKRNEPAYVIEVVKKLAELKNLDLETISGEILKNTKKAFNLA